MPLRPNPIQFTRSNDQTLSFSISTSVALASAKFSAKLQQNKLPAGDEITIKTVTTSLNSDGQITTAGPGVAVVKIILGKSDTALFSASKEYIWDLEVFDGSSKSTTPAGGPLTVFERARTATG